MVFGKVRPMNLSHEILDDTGLKQIFEVLGTDKARLVGGCVRNAILGVPVTDIDIATPLLPDEVMAKLSKSGIKVIPTGLDHGTVTAVIDKIHYEITTLRRDVETDGRHAVVAFTKSWEEDAQRRDFTMNTLLCDITGDIFDPTGQGLEGLNTRRVIFVGDPEQRIQEDYLRILRFFRFHAYYGEGKPDKEALKACSKFAARITDLSKERVTIEFFKILIADHVITTLEIMNTNNVMTTYFDLDFDHAAFERCDDVTGRLACLCSLNLDKFNFLSEKLVLSNKQIKTVTEIIKASEMSLLNEHDIKLALYRYDGDIVCQLCLMRGIDLKKLQKLEVPVFPVSGDDLIAKGFQSGPELGQKLKEIEAKWIENDFVLPEGLV